MEGVCSTRPSSVSPSPPRQEERYNSSEDSPYRSDSESDSLNQSWIVIPPYFLPPSLHICVVVHHCTDSQQRVRAETTKPGPKQSSFGVVSSPPVFCLSIFFFFCSILISINCSKARRLSPEEHPRALVIASASHSRFSTRRKSLESPPALSNQLIDHSINLSDEIFPTSRDKIVREIYTSECSYVRGLEHIVVCYSFR